MSNRRNIKTGCDSYSHFVYDDNDDGETLLTFGWRQADYERCERVANVLRNCMASYNAARESDGLAGGKDFVEELNG